MNTINSIILIGYVGEDPEIRYFDTGKVRCRLSLATHRKRGDREITDWHRLTAWGKVAKVIHLYVRRGDRLAVTGELTYHDGKAEILVKEVIFLNVKNPGGDQPN